MLSISNKTIKKTFLITVGIVFLSIGMYFFLMPYDIAAGGLVGLAMVTQKLLPQMSVSFILAVYNILLLGIGIYLFGKEFGGYTLYSAALFNVFIYALEKLYPMQKPVTDDILLSLIYGIIINGIAMGIIFNQGASTGGTDITAKIINKYLSLDIGKSLMVCDIIVTLMAIMVFGLNKGLYAMLGVMINSVVIDKAIAGFNTKFNLFIISSRIDDINRFILDDIYRGTTIYEAKGGFSGSRREVLQTVVNKREYIRIKNYVTSVDPKSFLTVSYATEVHGEGFSYELPENEAERLKRRKNKNSKALN